MLKLEKTLSDKSIKRRKFDLFERNDDVEFNDILIQASFNDDIDSINITCDLENDELNDEKRKKMKSQTDKCKWQTSH
jgi:hypothetical protein